jgi:ABC-2 type transport system ATP-binding protein
MTYSGIGNSRFVYAQIVDEQTGLVLGNVVTPVPVTLDGQTHTATVPLDDIAYTAPPGEGDQLTLQITSSATAFENFTSFGTINVSSVELSLPTVGPDANATPENSAPSELATAA